MVNVIVAQLPGHSRGTRFYSQGTGLHLGSATDWPYLNCVKLVNILAITQENKKHPGVSHRRISNYAMQYHVRKLTLVLYSYSAELSLPIACVVSLWYRCSAQQSSIPHPNKRLISLMRKEAGPPFCSTLRHTQRRASHRAYSWPLRWASQL